MSLKNYSWIGVLCCAVLFYVQCVTASGHVTNYTLSYSCKLAVIRHFIFLFQIKWQSRFQVINIVNLKSFSYMQNTTLQNEATFFLFMLHTFLWVLKSRWIVKIGWNIHIEITFRQRIQNACKFQYIVLFNIVIIACGSCVHLRERKKLTN